MCLNTFLLFLSVSVWSCMCLSVGLCAQPALAVVPPVGASLPSSSAASGSPAACVCGRCAQSHILPHKSGSVDTRHTQVSNPPSVTSHHLQTCQDISERCRATTWWCSLPSDSSWRSRQISPWQQRVDISSALITSEMGTFFFPMLCWRQQPTWHLSASSCSLRFSISCLESPNASIWVLLLWPPCCLASGLEEAEGK